MDEGREREEGWRGGGGGGLHVFPQLLFLNFAVCLGVAAAAAAAVASGLDLAFAQAPAPAHSVASGLDMRNCACLGFGDCSGSRSCRIVFDRGSSRL